MAQILDENLYFVSNPCIWEWSWSLEKYFGFEILELCIILWGTVVPPAVALKDPVSRDSNISIHILLGRLNIWYKHF